jgi:hypothetical protein
MAELSRRGMIGGTAGLVLALVDGAPLWLSPAAAVAAGAGFRILTPGEAAWVAALGEAIAPPTRAGGLAHYLDHHLAEPAERSLLAVRYLDVAPPYLDFYRPALTALAGRYGATPPATDDPRWTGILGDLGTGDLPGWQGPPPPFFLFAFRLDAIDIAYGTRAGFERLGVEYLAHIEPESDW